MRVKKLWWTYILQEGDNKMNELYHYGVLGMRWGVRRNKNNSKKTLTQRNIERHIDADAKYKKDDIEKLNSYKDHKTVANFNMNKWKAQTDRLNNNNDFNIAERSVISFFGRDRMKKILNKRYDLAKMEYNYSDKKVNELLYKLKDVPIKEIESYRSLKDGPGTNVSWMGTKYIRD